MLTITVGGESEIEQKALQVRPWTSSSWWVVTTVTPVRKHDMIWRNWPFGFKCCRNHLPFSESCILHSPHCDAKRGYSQYTHV